MNRKGKKAYLYAAPSLLLIGVIVLFPILYTGYISFTNMNVYHWFDYSVIGFKNYIKALFVFDSGFLNLDLQNYNIVEIVEDITLSVSSYIESKGISLVFDTDVEEKITACDGDKIERVILNLLSNAVKFTKPGGTIEVKMKDMGDSVQISVKDTGCGIPKDKLNVIFERFRQVDSILTRKAEGSGIGLSLVKALVEAHGGSIEVGSEIDKGTEFFINIPVNVQEATEILDKIRLKDDGEERKFQRINIEFSDIYS
jgi:signal transduction histidine kinase